jgi:hypothetical protein
MNMTKTAESKKKERILIPIKLVRWASFSADFHRRKCRIAFGMRNWIVRKNIPIKRTVSNTLKSQGSTTSLQENLSRYSNVNCIFQKVF